MMRKFLTALVLIPLAILFVVFAVANRHWVLVSFNPFNSNDPATGLTLPLFAVIILVAIFGVIAGSTATWLKQGHWRRTAREQAAEARRARAELADLRAQTAIARPLQSLPAPKPGALYLGTERDKAGATL